MVVLLAVILFVVRFVFVRSMVSLIAAGPLALLYHLYTYTHYTLHGGASHHGANCGAFSVGASADISATIWDRGAALSFKPVS